jgi:hypothetical protein
MNINITTRIIILLAIAIYSNTVLAVFEDDEGCLMCHKYPNMARITEDGARRSYYVMPEIFANTVHRNVPCRDCHTYIKELPHKPVDTGVTCNTECHSVKNPATGKPFSHGVIYDAYSKSVHGRKKIEEGIEDDKPYCITCHTNPLYNPKEEVPPKHVIDRCVLCHEDKKFAEQWYKHTSRRIKEVKRSSVEIVALCSSCHGDEKLIDRHVKNAKADNRSLGKKFPVAVESYEHSFHGKLTQYGFTKTANCLDCHAETDNYYKSVHEILPSRDKDSPVHKENRVETCKRCHVYADDNYANLDPHPTSNREDNVFRYYAEQIYNVIGEIVIVALVGLSLFETIGRRRDGVAWRLLHGSSWRRKSKRGRERKV